MNQRKIFAACIQETWRCNKEILEHNNFSILATGLKPEDDCRRGSKGVGIILSPTATDAWKAAGSEIYDTYGGRVMAIRLLVRDLQGRDIFLFLTSAYSPVGAADEATWEQYLHNLDECIGNKKADDILILGCDTNSSMGCSNEHSSIGLFGATHTNDSGRRFSSYLSIHNFVAATTFFRKRNYGTWVHPRSKMVHQIDHFITDRRTMCRISDAGVTTQLVDSDHLAIKCKLRVMSRLKKVTPIRRRLALIDYNVLTTDQRMKETFCKGTLDEFNNAANDAPLYTRFSEAIQKKAANLPKKEKPQPGWFQLAEQQLQPLIIQRNSAMKKFVERRTRATAASLRNCRKAIKSAIISAKNKWIQSKRDDLNGRSAVRGTKCCWDALKQLKKGLSKIRPSNKRTMKKENGTLCKTAEENAEVFRSHFQKLYGLPPNFDHNVANQIPQRPVVIGLEDAPDDTEIKRAISTLKENAPGDSGIPAKVWKVLSEYEDTFEILKLIIHDYWESELTPTEWEKGLLTILAKKGDLSDPGNYRGIMLLETAYKIIAKILNRRLQFVEEGLADEHESQCGFRSERGCTDANFTVKLAMKKRREHGLESWILFLDLVKAFDRVPRELLWIILEKLGVPLKIIRLLKSLHHRFIVKFEVNDIVQEILNIIGVKQGDILGPRLFNLFMFAVMQVWHSIDKRQLCIFFTKQDFYLTGRNYQARGEQFSLPDSQYADDTAILFTTRESLEDTVPTLMAHFAKFGLEIHVGHPGKKSKTEVLFVPAPKNTYIDPSNYDDKDLSNIKLDNEAFFPVVTSFCYLGSTLSYDCSDREDVDRRIVKASSAFGSISSEVFAWRNVSFKAKKTIYEGLILPVLLYGSETWCLTEDLFNKLRTFHARCIRTMCRVNRLHTWKHRISSEELRNRTGLVTIDMYVTQRQLRWAGHVARMDFGRLPRKMISSWVPHSRPRGCPRFTYGRGLKKALTKANINHLNWYRLARDRTRWRQLIKHVDNL